MAEDEASVAELQERLVTFNGQLETIQMLLTTDPDNQELVGIAADLKEVIKLTQGMLDHKMPNAAAAQASPYPVGTYVEALRDGRWIPGVVESIKHTSGSDIHSVHLLGLNVMHDVDLTSLRAIDTSTHAPLDPSLIEVGYSCLAKYYVDGQYYKGNITSLTPHGCIVLFDGYGNSEEVPASYLRAVDTKAEAAAAVEKPKKDESALISIPANLTILPTDTEAEKDRKRKRIRAIKSLNRHKSIDIERNTKQNDWAKFQAKAAGKKRPVGVISNPKKSSIFASPATVDGRVGVVGSDQKMTHFNDTRKKFKLAEQDQQP
ncbi:Aste57867_10351 [Aphanomyces stellatus]|uniref:Survival of motor neuron-related-splicing factor 30 n=1 Tax=Aphanomyces stellatus TaxID=120398 RepID=A0A485KQM6_9STRA|nr:hypothetical protein As57867_010311 [Aphanomyces stellatus]VFT87225.1 Aste57867_10351 [Aphanomyces stellatus]